MAKIEKTVFRAEATATDGRLVDKANIVCPYSNATHGNIDVTLTLV